MNLDQWPQGDRILLKWFVDEGKDNLPKIPWKLFDWLTIIDNERFAKSIEAGILYGPDRPIEGDLFAGSNQLHPTTTQYTRRLKFLLAPCPL